MNQDFKARFLNNLRSNGITVAQWSRERGFRPVAVSHVLNGQNKAMYGTGHQIAIALGMKPAPTNAAHGQSAVRHEIESEVQA